MEADEHEDEVCPSLESNLDEDSDENEASSGEAEEEMNGHTDVGNENFHDTAMDSPIAEEEDDEDQPMDNDLSDSGDSEKSFRMDYNCQLCGRDFIDINNLFSHLETHKSGDYAKSDENSSSVQTCFGDPKEARSGKKWPRRFLTLQSPVFEPQFQDTSITLNGTEVESEEDTSNDIEVDSSSSDTDINVAPPESSHLVVNGASDQTNSARSQQPRRQRYTCPQCLKQFRRSDHFRQHLINHQDGGNAFSCEICGQDFSVVIALRRHMMTHEEFMPFKCSGCPRRFQDALLLKQHEDSHFKLPEDRVSFTRKKCRVCPQIFGNEASRVEHERRVHAAPQTKFILRCRYIACREVCPTLKLLIQHYKDKHGAERLLEAAKALQNQSQPQVPVLAEPKLDAAVPVNVNGSNHVVDEDEEVPEEAEPVTEQATSSLEDGSVECRMCFQFLTSIAERNSHESAVHAINTPGTVLQCKYSDCRKILGAKNWLARHIREHRERINQGLEMESEEDLQALSKALNGGTLQENETEHALCDSEQMEVSDEDEDLWECRLCGQGFLEEQDRAAHEDRLHDTGNPTSEFSCRFCSKEVGKFSALLIHMDRTHGKGKEKIASLKPPKLTKENNSGTFVFPCRHCDLTFAEQHTRVVHEYDVHETRDAIDSHFPCKVCQKVMTLRSLRNHLRKIHGLNSYFEADPKKIVDDKKQELPKKIVPEKEKTSSPLLMNKKPSEGSTASWTCRLCFEQFDEQRQRETHEHAVHGTNSPNATYVCKYSDCELSFDTFRALIKHLREHGETTFPKGQQKLPTPSLTQYKQHI